MSSNAASLRKTGRMIAAGPASGETLVPESVAELKTIFSPGQAARAPFRIRGAGSSATDCNTSSVGTVVDMTGLNDIIEIDEDGHRITVAAGARIGQVADALAEAGMELEGSFELRHRTVGGAISGGCIGPSIGDEGSLFASQVVRLKAVTPSGGLLVADTGQEDVLALLRLSYGMFGAIYEVTLQARPIAGTATTCRHCTTGQFSRALESLVRTDVGLKFALLPFRDSVYIDLGRFDESADARTIGGGRMKHWSRVSLLPAVIRGMNRSIPLKALRYRMVDRLNGLSRGVASNAMLAAGGGTRVPRGKKAGAQYSTWLFPAAEFGVVVQAYRDFCRRVLDESGYRCDLPSVGYLLRQDRSALLSPCFDEPVVALRALSTRNAGWPDFAIDFSDFARQWGGMPLFDQSLEITPAYAATVFGKRLVHFRNARRQVDPENRLMNPFLSQYFL